ncbi:Disease resistance protein RPS2 [Acorus gramineus]|uniref:Disease resistance protein RPS2 n=1 Tax=Acorus gramineus TaxID=55184 RepID=A0AAV9A6T8_ACOGR|nr:Disease resistance protein RPS2 [Acorus gramineus]
MIDTTVVGQALDSALKELNCCFRREEATVVGIYGTGGIGKTTLLKIFNDELISKLVLTTRFEAVCNKMGVGDNKIRVNFMAEDEAWELFKMNCGENKFLSNARMENIAKRIAAKCGGLPLALIVIGRALASKTTIEEWKHAESALRDLRTLEIDGLQENLLLSLKYSYDNLHPDDKIKETTQKCFLYCCLFPEDYSISKEQLVEYWVGEGFLDEGFGNDIDRAREKGHSIIGRLKAACLLERGNDQDEVKMHDVIREMARWIANDCTGREHRFLIRTAGQRNINFDVDKWSMVERISLINIEFPHLPDTTRQWPNLWTLLLYNSGIERIPSGFFLHMGNLQVLDLSYTRISELPSGIESLVNLQYLDLSGTNIKLLPKEFGELRRLRQLYLALALPSLEYLQVIRCPKLKKLPLGPGSAPRLKEINGEQEWWDGLEWDDDQTRQVFAGRFKKRY